MCGAPDIPEPQKLQSSKEPVFNTAAAPRSKAGRQGTLLTRPAATPMAGTDYAPGAKKTLLGS